MASSGTTCFLVCIALCTPTGLVACGGDGDSSSRDAGPASTDAIFDDASPEARHLIDEIIAIGAMEQAFRESSQWTFDHADGWLVRLEKFTPDPSEPDRFRSKLVLYADEPGASALAQGAAACEIAAAVEVTPVDGYSPFDRLKIVSVLKDNDCTGTTGVTLNNVVEVVERDASGAPALLAKWQLLGLEEDDPRPDWTWVEDGRASPWTPCSVSERAEGRDYCPVDCDWDYIFDPVGAGCID